MVRDGTAPRAPARKPVSLALRRIPPPAQPFALDEDVRNRIASGPCPAAVESRSPVRTAPGTGRRKPGPAASRARWPEVGPAGLLRALALEPNGPDTWRAGHAESGHGVVFGGQLLGQALVAALAGQEGKTVKTLHTVFARAATPEAPLDIAVERMHAGRTFASSTVTIRQGERLC